MVKEINNALLFDNLGVTYKVKHHKDDVYSLEKSFDGELISSYSNYHSFYDSPYNHVYNILDLLKGSFIRIDMKDFKTILSFASNYSNELSDFLKLNNEELCMQEILFNFRRFAC